MSEEKKNPFRKVILYAFITSCLLTWWYYEYMMEGNLEGGTTLDKVDFSPSESPFLWTIFGIVLFCGAGIGWVIVRSQRERKKNYDPRRLED